LREFAHSINREASIMLKLSKIERALLVATALLLSLALFGPHLAQLAGHHVFADQRMWNQLPNAMDVLSNLPFAMWGAAGLVCTLWRRIDYATKSSCTQTLLAITFFAGLIVTASASTWYHLQPTDASLLIDRLGMVVAFAGLLGLAGADRVSARAGKALAVCVLVLGPVSIGGWSATGNVLPWLVLQFGGLALIAAAACLPAQAGAINVRWGWVVLIYIVAKLFEMSDAAVFDLSQHWVSGHSLKHGVASFAAWPVLAAIARSAQSKAESAATSGRVAVTGRAV
jgi:hypothetical protein